MEPELVNLWNGKGRAGQDQIVLRCLAGAEPISLELLARRLGLKTRPELARLPTILRRLRREGLVALQGGWVRTEAGRNSTSTPS